MFVLPEAKIDETVMTIPGTDGQKMSKSYGNTIDIFLADKALRKLVMSIVTDSTPMEEPKNPDSCNVFAIYQLLANNEQVANMRSNYQGGNYGYGHAKQALFELMIDKFKNERNSFNHYMNNPSLIDQELRDGEEKARVIAREVLNKVKGKLGF